MRYKYIILMMMLLLLSGCSNEKAIRETAKENIDLSCPDCNVVFLDVELLRADYVGLINPQHNTTPNIDRFFKNAIIFEDVSSGSGVTGVSNPITLTANDGIFTYTYMYSTYKNISQYSRLDAMPQGYKDIVSSIPTIFQVMHSDGYETISIIEDSTAGKEELMDRGTDIYWGDVQLLRKDIYPGRAIRLTREMLQERSNNEGNRSFFLLVRPNDLHAPAYKYPANRSIIEDTRINYRYIKEIDSYEIILKSPSGMINHAHVNGKTIMDNETLSGYQNLSHAIYQQQLVYVDEELGRLFSYLENSSLMDNTIVVLYSNHGDGIYDNGVPNHGVSYQSCVHVPVLILHPKVHGPIRITEPISIIDLVPTIYEMTNVTPSKDLDGTSLVPLIKNGTYEREYIYGMDEQSKYIRYKDMKLIVWATGDKELYNITADPHEENNMAAQYSLMVNSLYQILINHQLEETVRAKDLFLGMNITTDRDYNIDRIIRGEHLDAR